VPFNPITSTRTKLVELVFTENPKRTIRIYSHTSKQVKGAYITASGPFDWVASETLEEARAAVTSV
jgi:hypothetical protein